MTGKSEELHWHALHWVIVASKWKLCPLLVTVDFGLGLYNAINDQFEESETNGCLFHFKQALRNKMIEFRMSKEEIKIGMESNVIDLLEIIPTNEVKEKV